MPEARDAETASYIPHSAPWIVDEDRRAVDDALLSAQVAQGTRAAQLEQELASFQRAAGAVAVGSGTAALVVALKALEIGPGAEVILPTYVCAAVLRAIHAVGATAVLCDVGERWLMTPETVAPHITRRTRALIIVHLFGIAAETESFLSLGVPIIEDCCQALGAPGSGGDQHAPVGRIGALSVFSFHATKCLTGGEGGAVTANSEDALQRIREVHASRSVPAPLSDLQAALALSQLRRYPAFLEQRRLQATDLLRALPRSCTSMIFSVKDQSMFFRFPLRLLGNGRSFDHARLFFDDAGIAVRRGVDALLHRECGLADAAFPGAVACFDETISIPLRPGLEVDERRRILERASAYVGA